MKEKQAARNQEKRLYYWTRKAGLTSSYQGGLCQFHQSPIVNCPFPSISLIFFHHSQSPSVFTHGSFSWLKNSSTGFSV